MANPLTAEVRRILAEQGTQFAGTDDDLTLALGALNRPEVLAIPDFRADYDAIREANSAGTIGGIVNSAKTAFDRSVQAKNVIGGVGETDAADIAERERAIQDRPSSVPWQDWQTAEGMDAVKTFLRDPIEITSNIVASGLAGSLPAIGGGLAGGAAGGALGSAVPVVGTAVGGTIGAAAGTFGGSLSVEYGNRFLETLREAGADLTDPESIMRVVSDPEVNARARELGLRRGLPVAAFDAASAGLAGKFLKGARTAASGSTGSMVRRGLAEAGLQGGLGGAGEVAGAVSAGDEISPKAVFEEVVGEFGPGGAEIAGASLRRRMAEEAIAPRPIPGATLNAQRSTPNVQVPGTTTNFAPISSPLVPPVEVSPARRVALMAPEQQQARAAELAARTDLSAAEEQELALLRAFVGEVRPPVVEQSAVTANPVAESETPIALDNSPAVVDAPGTVPGLETAGAVAPTAAGILPVEEPITNAPPAAPAEFLGWQEDGLGGAIELWNLTADIDGHPDGSTVSRQTLESKGFVVPPPPTPSPVVVAEPAPIEQAVIPIPEAGAAVTPTVAESAPVAVDTTPTVLNTEPSPLVPAAPEPSPTLEQRLREELAKPEPIVFGPIASVDTTIPANLDDVAPRATEQGGVTKTREAAILQAPDGTIVLAGLTPRRRIASVGGSTQFGVGVQGLGTKKGGAHTISQSGKGPALLGEVVGAGYTYLGKVRFSPETEPGRIFQRWANRETFDASLKPAIELRRQIREQVLATGTNPVESLPTELQRIDAEANSLLAQQSEADPARALEIEEEVGELREAYRAQGGEPQFGTQQAVDGFRFIEPGPSLPAVAGQTQQLATAVARLEQWGAKVDIFTRELFQADLAAEVNRRMDALIAQVPTANEAAQGELQRQIEGFQAVLGSLGQVRGAMYSPTHIAVGLEDLQNANVSSMVWLLHEANHAILRREPAMQARVLKAVEATMAELRAKITEEQMRSGVREARLDNPEELIVSLMAQKLANEGIPDAPSMARAAWQWVKDLYYRLAMAVQAAFGVEPSPQLALDWFENQVRRVAGGDYDYRFNNLFSRFAPEMPSEQVTRFAAQATTPGAISDYFDPLTQTTRQPEARPDTREAVAWNLQFGTEDASGNPGGELDIPYTEAKARIMGAALNEMSGVAERMYAEATAGNGENALTFEQWWAIAGRGDSPKARLAELEQRVPGSGAAAIGGERMTEAMDQLARVEAKVLMWEWLGVVSNRDARAGESITRAENTLTAQAKAVNKVEGDLRNAEMHEATLGDDFKEMVRELGRSIRRGITTARQSGALAQAIRDAEGLAESEPIPAEYQRVFKEVMDDGVRIFDYLRGIASLDLPLAEMTQREIIEAVRDNAAGDAALGALTERGNRPLLVALVALSKKNAAQIDLIQLRTADAERYLKIKGELDEIRQANPERLAEIERGYRAGKRAATMADRIKRSYVEKRAKLRRAQKTIQEAEERREVLQAAREGILAKVDEMETNGQPAPSEWRPRQGETYLAMRQAEDGTWTAARRTLTFNDAGGATNPEQMLSDLAANNDYLKTQRDRAGSKTYQLVERQTRELEWLDVRAVAPEMKRLWFEKFLMTSGELITAGGGAGAARVTQMLKRFQFILFSNWQAQLERPSIAWQSTLKRVTAAAGMKDAQAFIDQIYEPAVYMLNTEAGLDEGPALRAAVKVARARLNTEPTEKFDETFKDLIRQTKAINGTFLKILEDNGVFVADDRLGGELRRAVSRGWLTLMRRMNASTVSTVLRDMEKAGWKIQFQDKNGTPLTETLDEGVLQGHRVTGSATFAALRGEDGAAVMEDPQLFAQAISGFFTPGVVDRWLVPFVNKPGEPLFSHRGEAIDQLDVQAAWAEAGGDVARWIDALGAKVGLERDTVMDEEGGGAELGDLSLEAEWRASMLRQIEDLFVMESRIAADANQTKGLFDATGRPPHIIMDARENELLPAEHVQHMTFDLINTKNLLGTLAFHAAFGRNGEAMTAAIAEIEGRLLPRAQAFAALAGGTKNARKADAKARGYDYDDLARAAKILPTVREGAAALRAQFGFGGQVNVLGDVRGALEVLHTVARLTTDNPKTGLLNMLQLGQRAIVRRSLGATVWRDTGAAGAEITRQFFGQVLQAFGLHVVRAAKHAKDIGAVQGQGMGTLPWTEVADIAMGKRGEELPTAVKMLRTGMALKGRTRLGLGEVKEFPALQAVPFVNNTMSGMSLAAAISNGTVEARAVENLVLAATKFYAANPDALNNPTHRLTSKDVGLYDKAWFADERGFEFFRRKMVEYGIGNLETVARQAMERQARGEPTITKEQVLQAAMMSGNELDLAGSINTNPAALDTNPALKFFWPLLGWPLRQMNQIHAALRGEDGRASLRSMLRAVGILAVWSMPIGLAFTFLSDEYDDKLLKKKSQLGTISDKNSAQENLMAVMQRLTRAGTIYSLGMDFATSLLSGLDPTSGQRQFSLDSRVLAFSQMRTLVDAISAWVNSGYATFAGVERPIIQAMGGNGALHALDLLNGALGLDNQEARLARRTNVNQWLRVAGREAGIEVRRGGGGSVLPTPLGTWTREMSLAAMNNDRASFLDAYRRALDIAREEKEPDPEARVLESWRSRNPMRVFAERPTDTQLTRALGLMSESGQEAVRDAMRLFDHYTELISPTEAQTRQRQLQARIRRMGTPPSFESLRRSMAAEALSVR